MNTHVISDYIENLPLRRSFGIGYRVDAVYDVICNICSMYNQLLSEAYTENDELKRELEYMEMSKHLHSRSEKNSEPELR